MDIESAHTPPAIIGPLQARVMQQVWSRADAVTVHDVAQGVNDANPERRLAYTTFLTVMRTLARRGLLRQERGFGRAHRFSATVSEDAYKRGLVQSLVRDHFNGDIEELLRYAETARLAPTPIAS
jgi:predicted transcriptional regulator